MQRELYRDIGQVAPTDKPVLIVGETGNRKELVARAIHDYSRRRDRPFITLNLAASAESQLERQLFGHEMDASRRETIRRGYFEHANGGTLFLDEIGEVPFGLQVKLLRVVTTQVVTRIGGESKPTNFNVRLISATHRDLELESREGRFQTDLYRFLSSHEIQLPES